MMDDVLKQPGASLHGPVLIIDHSIHMVAVSVVKKLSSLPVVLLLPRRKQEIFEAPRASRGPT